MDYTQFEMQPKQPKWADKYNDLIKELNKNFGDISQVQQKLEFTDWTKDGIVLLNGAKWESNSRGYRYLPIGNYKIVQVDLKLSTPENVKTDSIDIATLPDDIKPDGLQVLLGTTNWLGNLGRNGATEFLQGNTLKVSLLSTAAPTDGWSTSVWGSALYASNN